MSVKRTTILGLLSAKVESDLTAELDSEIMADIEEMRAEALRHRQSIRIHHALCECDRCVWGEEEAEDSET